MCTTYISFLHIYIYIYICVYTFAAIDVAYVYQPNKNLSMFQGKGKHCGNCLQSSIKLPIYFYLRLDYGE